jgi:hypothetical protein
MEEEKEKKEKGGTQHNRNILTHALTKGGCVLISNQPSDQSQPPLLYERQTKEI